jgi:hypothetical protein
MLQARLQGTKEWYRPDRDFLQAQRTVLKQALESLAPTLQPAELEDLTAIATRLAEINNLCATKAITEAELDAELLSLSLSYPELYQKLTSATLLAMYRIYRVWHSQMISENKDGTVDESKIQRDDGKLRDTGHA